MIKGELEAIERYVQQVEALKNYLRVKNERDFFAKEVADLKERLTQLEGQMEKEAATRKQVSSQLDKSESEAKKLGNRLSEAEAELTSLRNFRKKLPKGKSLTLKQLKIQFVRVEEEEIERRAKERLGELEKDMRSQMPARIHRELLRVLGGSNWPPEITGAIDSRASQITNEILRDDTKWPDWFKVYFSQRLEEAVTKKLDSEFEKRVKIEAQDRLDSMKSGEWQRYVAIKAEEITMDLKATIHQLAGHWSLRCDRCGGQITFDIGPTQIGELLGGKTLELTCSTCMEPAPFPFFLSEVPHKIRITIGDLVRLYFERFPPPDIIV